MAGSGSLKNREAVLITFTADLHIHTCLSPCGELEMSPTNIVRQALKKDINIIAICDHNSAENTPAVVDAAKNQPLLVLPGIEISTREEVHVLGLFENIDQAFAIQDLVYQHLFGQNNEDAFGLQPVVNAQGEVLHFNQRLLIGSTDLSIEEVVEAIHSAGGLAIAAHIDREGYGILGQLGFIPDDLPLDGIEISPAMSLQQAEIKYEQYSKYYFFHSSDAHSLKDIGDAVKHLEINNASFDAIKEMLITAR